MKGAEPKDQDPPSTLTTNELQLKEAICAVHYCPPCTWPAFHLAIRPHPIPTCALPAYHLNLPWAASNLRTPSMVSTYCCLSVCERSLPPSPSLPLTLTSTRSAMGCI